MIAITNVLLGVKFASTIVDVSSSPVMIGSLRPSVAEPVRRMMPSETAPPTSTPTDAAMYGNDAANPERIQSMPRSVAR